MPYAAPARSPTSQPHQAPVLTSVNEARPVASRNASSPAAKCTSPAGPRRIPAPSILPPVLPASATSTLHLALRDPSTSTSASHLSLSKQVDDLVSRHRAQLQVSSPAGKAKDLRVKSPPPPPIPPKGDVAARMPRGPLPVPPNSQQPVTPPTNLQDRFHQYQYPASYGPSISKIRSFDAQPPQAGDRINGLPPSLIPGGGAGYRQSGFAQPKPKDTVSRSFAKGGNSILLHKGFFDLLQVSGNQDNQPLRPPNVPWSDRNYSGAGSNGTASNRGWYGDRPIKPTPTTALGSLRAVTQPSFMSSSHPPPAAGNRRTGNRRISVDMVSRPMGFTHLVHASDAEQAEQILTRWKVDNKGKLPEPRWASIIKEEARTRARAQAVAQVQSNFDAEQQRGSLKVVNGNPDSMISDVTDRADQGSHGLSPTRYSPPAGLPPMASPGLTSLSQPGPPLSPSISSGSGLDDGIIVHENIPRTPIRPPPNMGKNQLSMNANSAQTVVFRNTEMLEALREDEPLPSAQSSSSPSRSPPTPRRLDAVPATAAANQILFDGKPFKPSLETVERSVATKIYLENHYYGILKRPRDRDQRRAALERELTAAGAGMSDAQRRGIRAAWAASETEHLRDLRARVGANSFLKVKTIGHGAFGVVSLVREKGSGELYAMKQLRKADMLRKGQEGHVRAERDVMSAASSTAASRWIVRLVYSFQDVDHLYLVMEYMGGGDLLNLLIEKDIFEEGFARFYIAEMVLAIQEAHKLGYIHRDIKPDNFIFSSDGHIKLSDFGLATDFHWAHDGAYYEQQRRQLLRKHGIDLDESAPLNGGKRFHSSFALDLGDLPFAQGADGDAEDSFKKGSVLTWREKNRKKLAYSVVGTNSYMSPEVIRGTGYDQSCDWWSLGIILFECLYGYPPFVSKSRHITRQKILTWRQSLRFPSKPRVSREAQDLISRLICEREDRLGSRTAPSTITPNSLVVAQRMSGFLGPAPGFPSLKDGAEDIKSHSWFRGIDFKTLHLQEPPFKPQLKDPSDTRYFDDDINDEPLPAPDAQPGQAEATKDPMLRHKDHGKHLLDVRKQLAFQGYTFKSPRQRVFDPRNGLKTIAADLQAALDEDEDVRGRSMLREPSSGFRRAMSL